MREHAEIIADIEKLVQEYVHLADDDEKPGLLTSCVVLYESTRYDENGKQEYNFNHFSSKSTSMVGVAGLIDLADKDMNHQIFGHCGSDD